MWKIEKIVSKGDYNYAVVKDHPNATKYGYVLEHRVVIENHLGRLLNSDEVVHHINHNKKDNSVENLEVTTVSKHSSMHGKESGKKMVELKCPNCSTIFTRRRGNTYLCKNGTYTCCSNTCRGRFSRKVQLHGKTIEVELAISGNIVREYVLYPHDNREQTENNGMRRDYTPTT